MIFRFCMVLYSDNNEVFFPYLLLVTIFYVNLILSSIVITSSGEEGAGPSFVVPRFTVLPFVAGR